MSSPMGATSRFRVFVRTYERTALPSPFPISIVHIVGLCRFHFSVQAESENVVLEIDWNEFVLSMPIHQFFKKNSHSPTNLAVNRNCVSTVMSEVEILSSFARDFCAKTLCTPVSLPFRDLSNQFSSYPWNCQAPPSGIHSPVAVR